MLNSKIKIVGKLLLPKPSGIKIQMMPIDFADVTKIPSYIGEEYVNMFRSLVQMSGITTGVGYITVDEQEIVANTSTRRPGLHIDDKAWGKSELLTVSNFIGCRAWNQEVPILPNKEGDCEHARMYLKDENIVVLQPNTVYFMNNESIHESIPPKEIGQMRSFVRLSLPSECPWWRGFTGNPAVNVIKEVLTREEMYL